MFFPKLPEDAEHTTVLLVETSAPLRFPNSYSTSRELQGRRSVRYDDNGNQHKVYSIGTIPNPDLEFAVDVQGLRLKSKLKRRLAYLAGGICYD